MKKWAALIIVAGIVVIQYVVILGGGKSSSRSDAVAYVNKLGADASMVAGSIQAVQTDVRTGASVNQVAQDAQVAHDDLNNVRADFAQNASGRLDNAEVQVFTAVNDMKNAMGALVAYAGSPNPATLAQFKAQYQAAVGEWDTGIRAIWRMANRPDSPTV